MRKRHEDDAANDGPDHREGVTGDRDHDECGQVEQPSQPRPNEGAKKAQQDGKEEASPRATCECAGDRTADPGDYQIEDELEHGHALAERNKHATRRPVAAGWSSAGR